MEDTSFNQKDVYNFICNFIADLKKLDNVIEHWELFVDKSTIYYLTVINMRKKLKNYKTGEIYAMKNNIEKINLIINTAFDQYFESETGKKCDEYFKEYIDSIKSLKSVNYYISGYRIHITKRDSREEYYSRHFLISEKDAKKIEPNELQILILKIKDLEYVKGYFPNGIVYRGN